MGPAENEMPENGYIALVCYVPEPQKSCIETLRVAIQGNTATPVHVTVLPPRPLRVPLEEACHRIAEVATDLCAFEVELSEVGHFLESNFLYLDIGVGGAELCEIHRKLNTGVLRQSEAYEFRPHLTLGGPLPSDAVQQAQERLEREWKVLPCPRSVKIDELVCLWLEAGEAKDWKRHRTILLPDDEARLPVSA